MSASARTRVKAWNELRPELKSPAVKKIYPNGMELLDSIYASAKQGKPIKLS